LRCSKLKCEAKDGTCTEHECAGKTWERASEVIGREDCEQVFTSQKAFDNHLFSTGHQIRTEVVEHTRAEYDAEVEKARVSHAQEKKKKLVEEKKASRSWWRIARPPLSRSGGRMAGRRWTGRRSRMRRRRSRTWSR
jgi:hypothetical protein